jgi:hypothetical protein
MGALKALLIVNKHLESEKLMELQVAMATSVTVQSRTDHSLH